MSKYSTISNFGSNSYMPENNPLTYAVEDNAGQQFMHGSSSTMFNGVYSANSQNYMANYCANQWDGFCELVGDNENRSFPNQMTTIEQTPNVPLSTGEILLRNTVASKYLVEMTNCMPYFEPFDPTVSSSPMIKTWRSNSNEQCIPIYAVNPATIDADIVMNKLLASNPKRIAPNILINIYNTMIRQGEIRKLQGTKLGMFYIANGMPIA